MRQLLIAGTAIALLTLGTGCDRFAEPPPPATVERAPPADIATGNVPLTGTVWQLIAINGQKLPLTGDRQPPDLQLMDNPAVAQGFSGCNRFSGSWKLDDEKLVFGPLAMTMMACMDGMEVEQSYMQALPSADRFAISGNELRFYAGNAELLLFRASR